MGTSPDGHKDFDTYQEALTHSRDFNAQNNLPEAPDWYETASEPVLVDLERESGTV